MAKEPRAQRAPSKYDHLTVYDPSAKQVIAADGSRASATPPTIRELSALPGPLAMLDRLYVCETANEETIKQLAKLANETVASLESRRLDYVSKVGVECPATTPPNRCRCMTCPHWLEATDDDLPF